MSKPQRVSVSATLDGGWRFRPASAPLLRVVCPGVDVSGEFFLAKWVGTHIELGDADGKCLLRSYGDTLEAAWHELMRCLEWTEEATAERPAEPRDDINRPQHYTHGPFEVIDIIEGFRLGFRLGNVIKYILRSEHKGAALKDLEKARWYLDREIAKRREAGE